MPTKLILVRHGQTLHNVAGRVAGWTDSPLSEIGHQQAEVLAAHVAERHPLEALYSSPLQRAYDTARAVGRRVGLVPVMREDLKEMNFGDLEDHTEAEIAARRPEVWAASLNLEDEAFAWPGGEARGSFHARVRHAFREIIAAHLGQTVAIVSHGGVLGTYVADLLEGRPYLWRKYLAKNCSITQVEAVDGHVAVTCFNDHSFLPDHGPDRLLANLALPGDLALPGGE